MIDLSTTYMGLKLKNPLIVGSCGLTHSVDSIKNLEEHGAAAVVLKSIFEEQILLECNSLHADHPLHTEEADYINYYTKHHNLDNYLDMIRETKKNVNIPVIASINCASSAKEWGSFAENIQDSGADGLELNMFILPGDIKQKGCDLEQRYLDIFNEVKDKVSLPLAAKISYHFTGLANIIFDLSVRASGIVLFNRFFRPDIDIEKEEITAAHYFSQPEEMDIPLRWIGMLSKEVKCDLAASTGVHDGNCIVKCLLAGAKVVQSVSAIYKNGPEHIQTMLDQLTAWMKKHKYKTIAQFNGKLAQENIKNPVLYERTQFMKYTSSK